MARGVMFSGHRRPASRGVAAVEFAMVMPLFLGIAGMCISIGLATLARFQMMDFTHFAVRACVAKLDTIKNVQSVGACINNFIAQDQPSFVKVCTLGSPVVRGPTLLRQTPPSTYTVSATLSCSFATGVPLVNALPGGARLFTVSASSTASTLPRWPQ